MKSYPLPQIAGLVSFSILLGFTPLLAAQKAKPAATPPPIPYTLDISELKKDSPDLLTLMAIQGLANRKAPQAFVFTGDQNWVATFKRNGIVHSPETLAKYRNTDDAWKDYYETRKGFQFQPLPNPNAFIEKFAALASGVVLFDPAASGQWVPAMGLCGPFDLLPVTQKILDQYPQLQKLPVRYDLRSRKESALELQQWAWKEVQGHCSKEGIYSIGDNTDRFAMDIAVARKLFVYRLGTDQKKTPDEFAMIQEMLKTLKPLSPAWGWGLPSESLLRDAASRAGAFVMCSEVPNISFHAVVKPDSKNPFHPSFEQTDPNQLPLENKIYVAFMVNEGDTMKYTATMGSYGMWFEPERGKFPINWGVSAWIYDHFPALMEYYYKTMSPKDCFFTACSGYGYFTPGFTPYLKEAAAKERIVARKADLRVACSWAANTLKSEEAIADWFDLRGLDGIREDGKDFKLTFTKQNRPILSTHWKMFYPKERFGRPKAPEEQLRREIEFLKALPEKVTPPFLVPFYGGNPSHFGKVVAQLPADKFVFVTVDEMMALARKIGRLQVIGETLHTIAPTPKEDSSMATITALKTPVQEIPVRLSLRNFGAEAQSGTVKVKVPAGWSASPEVIKYKPILAKTGQTEIQFSIRPAGQANVGNYEVLFSDSATNATARIRVRIAEPTDSGFAPVPEGTPKPAPTPPLNPGVPQE